MVILVLGRQNNIM